MTTHVPNDGRGKFTTFGAGFTASLMLSTAGHHARARDLGVIPSFDLGAEPADIPAALALHCDGLEDDPLRLTVSDLEHWYCYEPSGTDNDFGQIGWDDDGDRLIGPWVTDFEGAAIVRPLRAVGDHDQVTAVYTWNNDAWDWGGGTGYTVTQGNVLLVNGWLRAEGLMSNPSVQAYDCGVGDAPYTATAATCDAWPFVNMTNLFVDGYRDGIPALRRVRRPGDRVLGRAPVRGPRRSLRERPRDVVELPDGTWRGGRVGASPGDSDGDGIADADEGPGGRGRRWDAERPPHRC